MSRKVRAAFELTPVRVPLSELLPTRPLDETVKLTSKYKTLEASVREVGIIEPLVVHPQKGGKYLLLDGHVRLQILRVLEQHEALCVVSTDDEGYTYNHQINRLAPIQANRMIVKALDSGVSEERLARALNLKVGTIRSSRTMLEGICAESIELLKDKPVSPSALRSLRGVKSLRQMEIAELMVASGTYTTSYAEALVALTRPELRVDGATKGKGVRSEDLLRMENEVKSMEADFAMLDESYGRNVVDLTVARGYLRKLLDNGKIVRFLGQRYAEILAEIQKVVDATSLEG